MDTTFDFVVPTGDHIAEWMEDEGINAAELARRLGVTPKHVSELLHGKAPLSHPTALALERVTGVPARIWNLYESNFRNALASQAAEAELAAQYESAKDFPLPYLRKFGYIDAPARDRVATVRQLLTLLGAANLDAFWATWTTGSVAYRRSAAARAEGAKLATWLVLGERVRRDVSVPDFDRPGLESLIPEIRRLTSADPLEAIERVRSLLHDVGVALCMVPPVPGLGIHGATRWSNGTPILQLSLHMKSDDQLWFTVFHEIAHVLLHRSNDLFLDVDENDAEREADEFASETLVPAEFRDRLPKRRDIDAVVMLAAELEIAPSIVLGQTQRVTRDFAWGHQLKRKLEWAPVRSK